MTPETLRALLAREEGPNLEFKLEYVLDGPGKDRNRAEVAKDLLALVNSAGRAAKDAAHLILGAGDKLQGDGSHAAKDSKGLYSRRTFLDILNARCTPPVHDLEYDDVELDGVTYGVLTIPPSTAIHYLTQDLVTPKGSWRKNSVLIRHGDQVGIASPEEIARLVSQKTTSSRGASASWSQVDLLEASRDPEDSPYSHSSPITSDKADEEPIPADIQAALDKGDALNAECKYAEAANTYENAVKLAESAGNKRALIKARIELGEALTREESNVGKAREVLSACLADLKTKPDPKSRSTVLHLLGHIEICQGRIQEGKALCREALESSRARGDRHQEGCFLITVAHAEEMSGNLPVAHRLLDDAASVIRIKAA